MLIVTLAYSRRSLQYSSVNVWKVLFHYSILVFRWGFVVHGGIDGYSRHINCNNRAVTILELFLEAVEIFGLPSRVRADKGVENVDVAWHGICSVTLAEVLTGEALLQEGAATTNELKDCGEMFSLDAYRFVFEPKINYHLQEFAEGWNNHPLSSEANMSPSQLWLWGLHRVPYGQEHLSEVNVND